MLKMIWFTGYFGAISISQLSSYFSFINKILFNYLLVIVIIYGLLWIFASYFDSISICQLSSNLNFSNYTQFDYWLFLKTIFCWYWYYFNIQVFLLSQHYLANLSIYCILWYCFNIPDLLPRAYFTYVQFILH